VTVVARDVAASFCAELLKLRRRPAVWVLALVQAALVLGLGYGFTVLAVVVLSNGDGGGGGSTAALQRLQPQLYPVHFLQTTLTGLSGVGYGSAVAVILGALVTGGEYGWGTLKTLLSQGPSRLSVYAGSLAAVAVVLALFSLLGLAVGASSSAVLGAAYGHLTPWPSLGQVVTAFLAAWLIMCVWGALGVLLSVALRQTALAIGLGIVYVVAVEGLILNVFALVGSLGNVRRGFPGANATALVDAFGGTPLVGAGQATLVLLGYLAVFVAAAGAVLRRRDVS
jgi:ABC-2 type transport system permease protein